MATKPQKIGHRVRFTNQLELRNQTEGLLKRRYGRGIYIQSVNEASNDVLSVTLGNTVPKDISDAVERDGVMKFISVGNIYTLRAEPTSNQYIMELPERSDISEGFEERWQVLINSLDTSMAKAIYENVLDFAEVKNQLSPIRQIFRWVQNRHPISLDEIDENQKSEQTRKYIDVLSELGYLTVSEGLVKPADRIRAAEITASENQEATFIEVVMGDLVQQGYHTLRDRCSLNMLGHYPKFSSAYYYDALQRQSPDLTLDINDIKRNIEYQYGRSDYGELYIEDKLDQLSQANVLEKDGDYVSAVDSVFDQINSEAQVV